MSPKVKYTKDTIIDAAFTIAETEGLNAITARKIAEHLQGSVAPIYVNFQTMEELQRAVIAKIVTLSERILAEVEAADVFQKIGKASLLFAKRYPLLFRDMMWVSPISKEVLAASEVAMITMLKQTDDFKAMSDVTIKDMFIKIKIFQLGLSTMVAADQLPDDWDDQKVEKVLMNVGTLLYDHAKKGV